MQLPIRPMEVLARPSDDLMWCPAVDSEADDSKDSCTDREFKQELRHQLSCWLGWATCTFSSWQRILHTITEEQHDLVSHLNSTMFAAQDARVVKVEASCITSRMRAKKTPEADGQGVSKLKDLRLKCGRSGDQYLVLLDQRYYCYQKAPPMGPKQMRSQSILIRLDLEPRSLLVLQLAAQNKASGELLITSTNLAGCEVAKVTLRKDASVDALRFAVGQTVGHDVSHICMVLPDGVVAAKMSQTSLKVAFTA
ncbi:unnamed protein product [Effrenium voratum]|nr:unnamed protein product [Effrenium voratum]|mmetsp:Transcript_104656/g.249175  ORF Transcript_104656/g.249175 Transcript_104656/m.249175 type:complete len:253 (+) Transcript_104656:41-799(+)